MHPIHNRLEPSGHRRGSKSRYLLRLAVFSPLLLACSGIPLTCGRTVNKVIPAVREIDPDFDTDPVDCEPDFPKTSPKGCSIANITCGSIIEGNNDNRFHKFDGNFYVSKACTPERHSYEKGPDAPYFLELPANVWADIHLVSDCADLDIFSATWDRPHQCPTPSHTNINQCEADVSRRGGKITITTVSKPETHLVWVDGKYGATGTFRLEVKCREYR
jgi:hypothetical protein